MPAQATITVGPGDRVQEAGRNLPERDPRKRDEILRAAGRSRRDGTVVKAAAAARISGHDEAKESKIRSGQRTSVGGRAAVAVYEAALEALAWERAGQVSAFIEATLKAIAMWPELEKLTTEELHTELRRTIRQRETRANSLCNNLEADYLVDGALDLEGMLGAHTQQATASERIMAILQILAERPR